MANSNLGLFILIAIAICLHSFEIKPEKNIVGDLEDSP